MVSIWEFGGSMIPAIFSVIRGSSSSILSGEEPGPFTFNFNEAAETTLETIDSTWIANSTEFATTGDGRLVTTVPWDARKALYGSAAGGAQSIEVEWAVGQGFESGEVKALAVRADISVNGYSSQIVAINETTVRITLNKDVTQITNADVDRGVDITTITHLHKIEITSGHVLSIWYNGVNIINHTDSSDQITNGHPGFAVYPAGNVLGCALESCTVTPM